MAGKEESPVCHGSLGILSPPCLLSGQSGRSVSPRGGRVPWAWLNTLPGSPLPASSAIALKGVMASLASPAAGLGYHGALWGCLCDLKQAELQTDSEDVILSMTKLSPDDGGGIHKSC